MKTSKLITFGLVCAFMPLMAVAVPSRPTQCTAYLPKMLQKKTIEERQLSKLTNGSGWGQDGESTQQYWTVFSDRCNNDCYESPSTSASKCGKLDFNEQVRIAEIKNDFALVYNEVSKQTLWPTISTSAVMKGWVPMDNLLLWSTCPTNEYGIYNKALFMNNLNEARNLSNQEDIGIKYRSPQKEGRSALSSDYNFYFVMKKVGKGENCFALLARESNLNGKNSQVLYGWVHPVNYAPWSQRTCLEPNWEPGFVSAMKGTPVTVFGNDACTLTATSIIMGGYEDKSAPNDPQRYRLKPEVLRYPLLDNDRQHNLYHISAFAHHDGTPIQATTDDLGTGEATLQSLAANMSVVNIILVIDGTKGMATHIPYVKEAVKRAYDYFGSEGRTVRVGAVIYRDKADGQYETELCPLDKPNSARLENFLTKGGDYGIKSSPTDRNDFTSLYQGLNVALNASRMGYTKENTNLVFIVGQCGNDPNDKRLTQEQIVKKCIDSRIQLSAFMVHGENIQAFNLFREQTIAIMNKNIKEQYKNTKGSNGRFNRVTGGIGYDFNPGVVKDGTLFVASFRQPARDGESLKPENLYAQVKTASERFDVVMQRQIESANAFQENQEVAEGKGDYSEDERAAAAIRVEFIKELLKDKKGVLESLSKSKSLTAFGGYVKKYSEGASSNVGTGGKSYYWRPVIYISKPEFESMMAKLQNVYEAVENDKDAREPYVEAMKALVRSMLPGVTESEMNSKTNEEIMNAVAGLNERTETLENYKLIDIQSSDVVTDDMFRAITTKFIDKYKKLDQIRNMKYKFSVNRNGVWWYWIPADDLP